MTRSKVIQTWFAAVLLVAVATTVLGPSMTIGTAALLLALCRIPPFVVFMPWPFDKALTLAEAIRDAKSAERLGSRPMFDWLTRRRCTTTTASLALHRASFETSIKRPASTNRCPGTCATALRAASSSPSRRLRICSVSCCRTLRGVSSPGGTAEISPAAHRPSRSRGRSRAGRQRSIWAPGTSSLSATRLSRIGAKACHA